MVRTEDACEIIKYALQNEIKVYLDGGWGVEADGVFQIMLRHILGPQGVAGHQHNLGNIGLLRRDAGRGGFFDRHFRFLLVYFLLDFTFCCRIMPSNSRYTAPGRYLSP